MLKRKTKFNGVNVKTYLAWILELGGISANRYKGAWRSCTKRKEVFIGRRGREKEVSSKERIVSGEVTFLWGTDGVCQEDVLAGAEVIPDLLLKGNFPGRG